MSMTPERIEEIKRLISKHKHFDKRMKMTKSYNEKDNSVIRLNHIESRAFGFIPELLAALEESQQRIGKLELYVKSLEFNRDDTQKRVNENLRERDTKLVEAQQTIARQREAFEKITKLTASNPTDLYWRGAEAIEIARKELGNKEGSYKA